jgi:hypothetical protein
LRVLPLGFLGAALLLTLIPVARSAPPTPRFALGINEAVAVPDKAVREHMMDRPGVARHLQKDAERALMLGAHYVRGNTGAFPRSSYWSSQNEPESADYTDLWVQTVQANGLEPVLMVSPWPGNRTGKYTPRYVPADLPAYTAWVRALAERYDGDGLADMPGLRGPIRYWEVDNEPDLKFTAPPKDATRDIAPGTFCTPAEAAEVLLATSGAIRAAHPGAVVLNGGIFRPHTETGRDYLRKLLAVPGVPAAFDVLSLHSYATDEPGRVYASGLADARGLASGKPIFVTETSVPSSGGDRWMTPEWQARMVASVVARGAIAGAEAVFWHTLADPPPDAPAKGGFGKHSLLETRADGSVVDKPAATVYRNLAGRLASDDLLGAVQDGGGAKLKSGAVLLYEGPRLAPHGAMNLLDGSRVPPGGTAWAPAWIEP